jgi:hypothetical protein
VTGATKVVGMIALAVGLARALASCIIADPPPEPPAIPAQPPSIGPVSPPPPVFYEWPSEFAVGVFGASPFVYGIYVDGAYVLNTCSYGTGTGDGGYELVEVDPPIPDAGGCHVVSFFAQPALGNSVATECEFLGYPGKAPGAAEISWLYDPTGQGACTNFAAGTFADGAFPPPPAMDGFTPPMVGDGAPE